jgi:RNA polymerase sigma-B factor
MPGSRHPHQRREYQGDLDAIAVAYAHQWRHANTARRGRLREDLICRCLPFADRMARRYSGRPEPLDDLEQVARLGLVKAVDRYDPERGSFTAFAVITICGEIKRHFRDRTWGVHVNRRMQNLALEIGHAAAELTHTLSRAPTAAEIARHLDVSPDEVRHARLVAAGHTPLPFSTPVGDGGTRELGDLIGARDESIEVLADKLTVAELLLRLPARTQRIVMLRFYGNLTQAQIATEFGISQMQISRLLRQALTWLRAAMLSDVIPPWDGVEQCHHPESLQVRIEQTETVVNVAVVGEVDRDCSDRLWRRLHSAIATASPGRLVVDLAGVPLVDVAGAGVLRDACMSAAVSRVRVTFVGLQPHVATVLAMAGVPASGQPADDQLRRS